MKSYDWKYIFKKVTIFFIIFIILSFVKSCNVHALEYVKSGDSLKGLMKIGTRDIGSNYYYEVASGVWDESRLSGSFQIDWHDIEEDVSDSTLKGTTYKNFVVEFCVNGSVPSFQIWSSYYNNVDYMYPTNTHIYLAEGEWSYASCYRAFISIYLNVQFSGGNSDINWYTYTPYNNVFAMLGNDGFNKLIRYTDLIYYNNADYNTLLEKTKTEQLTIQQNNTIINQNTQINDSINDVNDSINDDNVSGAESQVNDLLNNSSFQDNSGIQAIVTAPLNFIQGLSNSCTPISLTIPFIDTNVTIPCIKQELTNRVPSVVSILSTIINGFIIYRILLDIFAIVKSAREPDEDRIEVLDL